MNNSNQVVAIWVIVLLILGGVTYFILHNRYQGDENAPQVSLLGTDQTVTGTQTAQTNQDNQTATTSMIMLGDNASGTIMHVDEANLLTSGYIALYRVESDNKVTLVGKSNILPAGMIKNLTIETTSALANNQALIAVLYADDGDGKATVGLPDRQVLADNYIVTDIDIIGQDKSKETETALNAIQQRIDAGMK